jgi:N utilization substance protein A
MSNLENKLLKGAEELAKEKKVPTEVVVTQLKAAIAAAYEKEFPGTIVEIDIDLDENKMNVFEVYEVIAEETDEFDDYNQILLVDAEEGVKDKKLLGEAVVGKQVRKPVELSKLNNKVISLISANFVKNLSFESNKTIFAE